MAKTDKELTVEVVNTFVTAWFSKSSNASLKGDTLPELIKDVYTTIANLEEDKQ